MAASTCSGFPAAPAPPVAISAFLSLRKRGCFWPGFSFEVGSAFQAAAQILGACIRLPPCSVLEVSCPLSSQPHLALAPSRALTCALRLRAHPVVPEAPVGMALFSDPTARPLLPLSQGLTPLLRPAARPVYSGLVGTCVCTAWPLPLSSTRISVASLSYPLILTQVSGRTVAAVALAILGMRSAHLLHSPGCGFPTASPSPAEQALWEP